MNENNPRQKAEQLLRDGKLKNLLATDENLPKIIHELHVHQIELEMQNDELRQTQLHLKQVQQKYSDLYQFAPIGYFTFDKNGCILEVNLAGAELLMHERSQLVGRPLMIYLTPESLPMFYAHTAKTSQTYEPQTCELTIRHISKKTQIYVQVKSVLALDDNGEFAHIRSAMIDITKRKQFEDDLKQVNLRLSQAYDETLEGWARALELRDAETKGHSQRVTDIMVKFARVMRIEEQQITYIRWGALLHDIGKMGVPDNILLKHGALTEEEWKIMRQHPVYAYQMLSPIAYLRPALDIPYYHHEKWDGSGYPFGLRADQIPLVARMFAVVDAWDALTNDRPYRVAWSRSETMAYLREQSEHSFDPKIVEIFLQIIWAL